MSGFWIAVISGGIGMVVGAVGLALLLFFGLGRGDKRSDAEELDED